MFGDGPHVDGFQPCRVNAKDCEVLIGERANFERNMKGKQVQVDPESDDSRDLVELDYVQEVEDIATETCYEPSNLWDTLQVHEQNVVLDLIMIMD